MAGERQPLMAGERRLRHALPDLADGGRTVPPLAVLPLGSGLHGGLHGGLQVAHADRTAHGPGGGQEVQLRQRQAGLGQADLQARSRGTAGCCPWGPGPTTGPRARARPVTSGRRGSAALRIPGAGSPDRPGRRDRRRPAAPGGPGIPAVPKEPPPARQPRAGGSPDGRREQWPRPAAGVANARSRCRLPARRPRGQREEGAQPAGPRPARCRRRPGHTAPGSSARKRTVCTSISTPQLASRGGS